MRGLCGTYRAGPRPALDITSGGRWTPEERAVHVVFDGRIYDRAAAARAGAAGAQHDDAASDAELVARLYEARGIDGAHALRGVFAFALLDRERERLYLVRDRLGVKPLYWASWSDAVVFATRIASIFSTSPLSPAIELKALRHLLFGVTNAPQTLYEGIRTVPPGHFMAIDRSGHRLVQYWEVPFPDEERSPPRGESEYVDELGSLLADTVRLYAAGDLPTALLLSGGLDSSVVGRLAGMGRTLRSYTVAFTHRQHRRFDESDYAREVADLIGSDHTELEYRREHIARYFLDTLRQAERPTYPGDIGAAIPFYRIAGKMGQDGIRVVLAGAGADEIFGGYPHHQVQRIRALARKHGDGAWLSGLYRMVAGWSGEDHRYYEALYGEILRTYGHELASLMWIRGFAFIRESLPRMLNDDVRAAMGPDELGATLPLEIDAARYGRLHPFDRSLYLDIKTRLVDFVLLEQHQMTQAFGIELRLPYLDHRLVEYVAAIPPDVKMRGLTAKHVLKEVARRSLPPRIVFRQERRGFVAPFASEVFMDRRSVLVDELLSPSAIRRAGYLRPAFVAELLERYRQERDPTTRAACEFLLERALIIQGIDRIFIRGRWWAARLATLAGRAQARLATARQH